MIHFSTVILFNVAVRRWRWVFDWGTNFLKAEFISIVFPWDVWPKDYKSKYDLK